MRNLPKEFKITFCFCMAFLSKRKSENLKFFLMKMLSLQFYIKSSEALDFLSLFAAETYRKNSWLQLKTPVHKFWVSLLRLFQFELVEKLGVIIQISKIHKKLGMPVKLEFWKLSQKNRNKFCWISTEVEYLLRIVISKKASIFRQHFGAPQPYTNNLGQFSSG